MHFHYIYDSSFPGSAQRDIIPKLLGRACATLGISCTGYDVSILPVAALPVLGEGDLLYRGAFTRKAVIAERMLVGPDVTSFRSRWQDALNPRGSSYFLHKKLGFPVIPSYTDVPRTDAGYRACFAEIGTAFPVIIKVLGGTLGVGVMRVDTMESLRSTLDYVASVGASVLIRKYIDHDHYVRAIVVGERVVAAHAAYVMDGEFRTNAGDDKNQKRRPVTLSPEVARTVVDAVKVLGFETGGVDLLYDKHGNLYIAEVNFPNNFTVTARVTGIDIAHEMVRYLIEKQAGALGSAAVLREAALAATSRPWRSMPLVPRT